MTDRIKDLDDKEYTLQLALSRQKFARLTFAYLTFLLVTSGVLAILLLNYRNTSYFFIAYMVWCLYQFGPTIKRDRWWFLWSGPIVVISIKNHDKYMEGLLWLEENYTIHDYRIIRYGAIKFKKSSLAILFKLAYG